MSVLSELLLAGQPIESHRPWPRAAVDADTWRLAAAHLAEARLILLDRWGERDRVHKALLDEQGPGVGVVSLDCKRRSYLRSGGCMRPLCGSNAPPPTCSA